MYVTIIIIIYVVISIITDSEVSLPNVDFSNFFMENQQQPRTSGYGITLLTLGAVAVLIVLIVFIDTTVYIMKNSPSKVKTHTVFVVGIYPMISITTYCAILVPRASPLAEAIIQGIFMVGMYQLFCLLVAYCDGESELIRKVKPNVLIMKVTPCCCWPCCCLPELQIDKRKVKILRLLVLQLPIIQGLFYMALLVIWAERESLYEICYVYMHPLIIVSILTGMWSMRMTIQMLKEVLKGYFIFAKFIVMQLVLLLDKLQTLITKSFLWADILPCNPPLTPAVYTKLICNTLTLVEMVILAVIVRKIYRRELPDTMNNNKEEKVCISRHIATIENIMRGTIQFLPSPTASRA